MQRQLEKILNLIKKTGDRMVVVDKNNPDENYVVMGLEQYEYLLQGNEFWMDDDDSDDYNDEYDYDSRHNNYREPLEDEWEDEDDTPPSIDYEDISGDEGDENEPEIEDFYFPDEEFAQPKRENSQKLDNNAEYGKMNYEFFDEKTGGRGRWEIPKDIKKAAAAEAPAERSEEDDRYYLETI